MEANYPIKVDGESCYDLSQNTMDITLRVWTEKEWTFHAEPVFSDDFKVHEVIPGKYVTLKTSRKPVVEQEVLGWCQRRTIYRMTFPGIHLNKDNKINTVAIPHANELKWKHIVHFPRNAFLASSPKGKYQSLPDRDEVVIKTNDLKPVTIYTLDRFRTKLIRNLLAENDAIDLVLLLFAYIFPTVITAGYAWLKRDRIKEVVKEKQQRMGFLRE